MSNVEHKTLNFFDSQRKNLNDKNNLDPDGNEITLLNEYDISDQTKEALLDSASKGMRGLVQIHETLVDGDKQLLMENNNLIVYPGRVQMLCRAFNKDLDYLSGSSVFPYKDMKNDFIAFFAVGNKGSSSSNNQNPLSSNSTDYGLGGNGSGHGSVSGATKAITVNGRSYMGFDDNYPKYIPEPEILNNATILSTMRSTLIDTGAGENKRDSYLIANVQVTLAAGAANGTSGTQEISEAGLFLAPSDAVNGTWQSQVPFVAGTSPVSAARHLEMFARVCFPTITKSANRSFTISWYIFF